ncbi:glyoxalase [Haladaptatus sp. W1]|uniref:VOC family protein n=1 Tax=Haladaptatus sp. W1 TaxID=1897478 RepID=UPI000849A318|nr:VOC family protein [Haladaptatus sp. W1]ODR83139.1 glyoxalase [Haladaptatus sp. W1]
MESTISPETTVGRVALRVNDLDRVRRFYETVVGLERLREDGETAVLGAGGVPLLELVADADAPVRRRTEAGLFHTAFLVPSRSAVADALVRIENDWELSGASDHRVSEALYLTDPEGNGVEIYRDRPREEWPVEEDGSVRMETLPLDIDELREQRTDAETVPSGTTVGHVHLEVSSLSAAREFYVETLGTRIRQRFGPSALFLATDDYHHHIGLNTWNDRTEPTAGRGLLWFELVVPDRAALDEARHRFAARGVETTSRENGFDVSDSYTITLRLTVND